MEKMKTCFVSPPVDGLKTPRERLGLEYLAAWLDRLGYESKIVDFELTKTGIEETVNELIDSSYELVGFSLKVNQQADFTNKFVSQAKQKKPSIKTVAGGYAATLSPKYLVKKVKGLDFIVQGEGEITLVELIKALEGKKDFYGIPGLGFKEGKKWVFNGHRPLIEDIDTLPFPRRDFIEQELKDNLSVDMITSRGCAMRCGFCAISSFYNQAPNCAKCAWRGRSAKNTVDEIESLVNKYGVTDFTFDDDNLFGRFEETKSRALDLAKEIKKRSLKIRFRTSCRSDNVDKKIFTELKKAGLWNVFIGIESMVPRVLQTFNKRNSVEQNEKAIKTLKEAGIDMQLAMLWFDEQTTLDEIKTNLAFVKRVGPENLHHMPNSILRLSEGTPLQKKHLKDPKVQYDEKTNAFLYKIKDKKTEWVYNAMNDWTKKYYQLYQLLARLRYDYWHLNKNFCDKNLKLYKELKDTEIKFFEENVETAEKTTKLEPKLFKENIVSYKPELRNLLANAKEQYDQVVSKDSPVYVDFKIH